MFLMRYFENFNHLQGSNVIIINTAVFYFVIILLTHVCFLKHLWNLSLKLTMKPLTWAIIWQHQLLKWRSIKNPINLSRYSYFHWFIIFHFDFKLIIKYTATSSNLFHFYDSYFSRVRHTSHPGQGHGSLTCHMSQFERCGWLLSANFITIMIKNWLQ